MGWRCLWTLESPPLMSSLRNQKNILLERRRNVVPPSFMSLKKGHCLISSNVVPFLCLHIKVTVVQTYPLRDSARALYQIS